MRRYGARIAAITLIALGAAGCADLDVTNPNDPTRDQAMTATDVESYIGDSFNTWYNGNYHWTNTFWISNASFQSISSAACGGNIDHSGIPRTPIINDPNYVDCGIFQRMWGRTYQALRTAADGLLALDELPAVRASLEEQGPEAELRLRAFARTVQALGHATLAVFYDRSFVLDETTEILGDPEPIAYDSMMERAYGYFDEAIALAGTADFMIPAEWMSVDVTSGELVELLHSWRAIFRVSLPRWSNEPVDWTAVLADLDQGLTGTFAMEPDWTSIWYNGAFDIVGGPNGWGAESYFIIGMADQSGDYQRWLATPVQDRVAWFGRMQDDDPFLIETPDTRFPRGTTLAEQEASPGEYYVIPRIDTWGYDVSEHFTRPARGTWRWSYYYYPTSFDYWFGLDFTVPLITAAELDLLRAEALLETGNAAAAADLVNRYRTAHGLAVTDATGTNEDCVPRLPDGSCGGLMEMLKWEKRLEVESVGLFNVGWYWDGRRWGDLYYGTPLQWPIPGAELHRLGMDYYTFGGAGETAPSGSPGSTYDWPYERDR